MELSGGDYEIVGVFPETVGVEDLEIGDHRSVGFVHDEFVGVGGVFGNDGGFLLADGDGGDFGAVDASEFLGGHVAGGALLLADADESAALVDDAHLFEFLEGTYDVVGFVALSGLVGDVVVFFLVGFGEVADVLVEAFDDDLVVLEFGSELVDLCFLAGDALFEFGDEFLEFGVFLAHGADLGIEGAEFGLVVGEHLLDGLDLLVDFALDGGVAFDAATVEVLDVAVLVGDGGEVVLDLVEHFEESVNLAIFLVDDGLEGVGATSGGGFDLLGVVAAEEHNRHESQ